MKGKFKKKFKHICNRIHNYVINNKVFLSFVVLSVLLGLLLRIITIGGHLYIIKAIISDLMAILIIGSFSYLLKVKSRYVYFLIWLIFFSLLCIGNTIYYRFYQSFISVNLISTASMIGEVNDSLFAKIHLYQFVYLIFPLVFIIFHKYLLKHDYYKKLDVNENNKSTIKKIYLIVLIIFIILLSGFTASDGSRFIKQWNREYIVQKYGLYIYTFNDLVQSIQPRLNTLYGYDEAASSFRNYYACKKEEVKKTNEYTNIFEGKNVIFIHAESIQNFLIDLKINGEEVIPNINKLAKNSIYFDRFYPQISVGTSSDTEFTLLTGLMPSSSGTVFVNYYDRTYKGMPSYFADKGYYTFSMHANNADYWNRRVMHNSLGYIDFYAKDRFFIPDRDSKDYVGLGLSDKSFFEQLIPILSSIKNTHINYFGTIITLSNHSPFNDVDKYLDFDVNMNYEYTDMKGNKKKDVAPYLEGTTMGNYLKSAHYADYSFGLFMKELESNNLLENTVLIFYGDHESRISKSEFDLLYNYDPETDSIKPSDEEGYISIENYNYDLLKNTPLMIYTGDETLNKKISKTMGMYDVLPTIANMFGFSEEYSLGHDIFSDNEGIVVFPNGNVLTDKVYYNYLNEDYVAFSEEIINNEYIDDLRSYTDKILNVSDGIILHDLIKNESDRIGETVCEK